MTICSTGFSREAHKIRSANPNNNEQIGDAEPLVVKPRIAWHMLNCSNTRGYELLAAGELESFKDGRSRKIMVASIKSYIARKLAR